MYGNQGQSAEAVPAERYIDLAEAALRLGYSTRWLRDRIRLDGLPARQLGRRGRYRLLWSEVEAWLGRACGCGDGHGGER